MNITMAFLLWVPILAIGTLLVVAAIMLLRRSQRRAKRWGYASFGAYLRAVARTDAEKRDAVDLALKGMVICLLGLLFPPLILIGVLPLFYGARKIVWAEMGLGLVDDADQPST